MNTVLLHKEKRCLDATTNLSYRFEDWFYEERKIKRKNQAIIAEIFTSK